MRPIDGQIWPYHSNIEYLAIASSTYYFILLTRYNDSYTNNNLTLSLTIPCPTSP